MTSVADASPRPGHARGIAFDGEIDLHNASSMDARLRAAEGGDLAVDLSAVEFIDVAAGRVLLAADRRAAGSGRRMVIVHPSVAARRLLELTGFAEELLIVTDPRPVRDSGDLDEALRQSSNVPAGFVWSGTT